MKINTHKSILLLFVMCLICSTSAYAQLAGWEYYTPITITNVGSNDLNSFAVKIYVNTSTLIGAGQMQPDGRDVRFGSSCSGGTSYHFCIDSGMNSSHTMMHIQMDLPAGSDTTVYMFYGNSQATSAIDPSIYGGFTTAMNGFALGTSSSATTASQRGIEFMVNQPILVANMGKRTPNNTGRYVTIFDSSSQAVLGQTQVWGPDSVYSYAPLPLPVYLLPGNKYTMEVEIPAGDKYFVYTLGTMPSFPSQITYLKGRYCNSCAINTYPNTSDASYFAGYPDFQFCSIPTLSPAPTFTIGTAGQGTQITLGSIADICTGTTSALLPYSATVGNPATYSITWNSGAISAGFTNVLNAALPASPIHITVPATANGYFDGTLIMPGTCAGASNYHIGFSVSPLSGPSASVSAINTVAAGTSVTYTATTNGASPSYQWKVNGANVGSNSNTYTYTPLNHDLVKCKITVTPSGCIVIDTATSNTISMAVFPLSVSTASGNEDIKVYPNPVKDVLNIDQLKEGMSYRLHNIIGTTLQQGLLYAGSNNVSMNMPAGIYMLELTNSKGERIVMRIVKD